ncbi:MAG: VPLPA-CTERM sorting domain-containing protein [Proteobacteria bacterium]|nr:VPLPA-CTERM sorting domain-containing protein [Pseudomonadota bacterium]
MKKLNHLIWLIILGTYSSAASAALLDFNDPDNLGVTLGGVTMTWNGIGGGHLYADHANDDDEISFSTATYVNSFEMNAKAWEGFTNSSEDIGMIDIIGYNTSKQNIWETTVDLTDYTDWNDWLTVSVETADIMNFTFLATGLLPHDKNFWPSIDNMIINEQMPQVPVPAAIWLFISGLAGIFGTGLSRRLSK